MRLFRPDSSQSLRSLNELQRSVYDLIVRRFLSIFYPAAEYQTVKLVVAVGEEKLFAGAKALKVPGFLRDSGRKQEEEKEGSKDENEETDSPGLSGTGRSAGRGAGIAESMVIP